ncbi:MAG: prepilin-type N-terminal cleavage/methylation domain-containing protein [Polyangiales bacterium]
MRRQGFTLIELMVAMVVGLAAVTSVYALGSAMSEQFFVEQRVASAQAASRVAIMDLRHDISRAGLFGTPNGSLQLGVGGVQRVDATCGGLLPQLPLLDGAAGVLGAFQYYANEDIAVLDPSGANTGARSDRLRILTSLYLTEQLLIDSTNSAGDMLVLQAGNQAYRRTFGWGSSATTPAAGAAPNYLNGTPNWNAAFAIGSDWDGLGMMGARAFQSGSVLHIESPEGRHFYRTVFGKGPNANNEVRLRIADALPIGTGCLPGAAGGATVSPLQWVEYAVIDPFDNANPDGIFAEFDGVFSGDLTAGPAFATIQNYNEADLLESPNRVLVRRLLNANDGTIMPNSTQVIAEFVAHFEVTFVMDLTSGQTPAPTRTVDYVELTGAAAEAAVNASPHQVRSVVIDLGIRSPLEDPSLEFNPNLPTRFETNAAGRGSARVRRIRIEVPVEAIARRNLG